MTTAKEHADSAREWLHNASGSENLALVSAVPHLLVMRAQNARLDFVCALVSLLRFFNALPEPVAIPPVPQPSDEAKRRGVLVGAVVRDVFGDVGRVVSHGSGGLPLVQWRDADRAVAHVSREGTDLVTRCGTDHLTVIRPAPPSREPNAEAVTRGLYIGARVNIDDTGDVDTSGEIVGWDSAGDPIVEHERWCAAYIASDVTLAGDAS